MVQDAPMITGISMSVQFLLDLGTKASTLSMVKVEAPPTGPKISALLNQTGSTIRVFGGLGGLNSLDEFERGASGLLPGSAFPDIFVSIYNAFRAGAVGQARAVYEQHLPICRFASQSVEWSFHSYKYILWKRGVIRSPAVRRPTIGFDSLAAHELEVLMNSLPAVRPSLRVGDGGGPDL
jgi:dihydrodipicolinate synthase/N-acetylneuraminate lyase